MSLCVCVFVGVPSSLPNCSCIIKASKHVFRALLGMFSRALCSESRLGSYEFEMGEEQFGSTIRISHGASLELVYPPVRGCRLEQAQGKSLCPH